ncbi:MAG TPA: hypothetical protein DEF42_13935 [Desulfosporosinus sp.]|nr:hypothetical protein [Desulfosporosinus sp.]
MNWKKPFLASIISLTFLTVLTMGCNQADETPSTQPSGPQLTETPKVSYVGDESCKACHTESYENVTHTKHYDTFKPLSAFPLDKPLEPITIFDAANKEKPTSTTLDLSKAKVYGVMVNNYIIAEIPKEAGFKNQFYRVGALKKTNDKWAVEPPKKADIDKDGKNDWTAESYANCAKCHSPGVETGSPNYGISCESCHGPAGNHVSATDKKGTMSSEVARNSCNTCHESNPSKNDQGTFIANNHYGTRNYFASKHAQSSEMNQCLTCHTSHKANANGSLLPTDKPTDNCLKCHAGKTFNLDKLMWKNPTDDRGHFTKDHSFGAMKYEDLQDDPATKPTEIRNPAFIELIKKHFPELAK